MLGNPNVTLSDLLRAADIQDASSVRVLDSGHVLLETGLGTPATVTISDDSTGNIIATDFIELLTGKLLARAQSGINFFWALDIPGSDVNLVSNGDISIATLERANQVQLNSLSSSTRFDQLGEPGTALQEDGLILSARITAAEDVIFDSIFTRGGNVDIIAGRNVISEVQIRAGYEFTPAGNVTINAGRDIDIAGIVSGIGDVLQLGDGGDITLRANGSVILIGGLRVGSCGTQATCELASLRNDNTGVSGDITIEADGPIITSRISGRNISLISNSTIDVSSRASEEFPLFESGTISDGGSITVISPSDVVSFDIVTASVRNAGDITILSGGKVDTSGGIINATGGVQGGDVTIQAQSDIDTGDIVVSSVGFNGKSGDLVLESTAGRIDTTRAPLITSSALGNGGNIMLLAAQGISTSDLSAESVSARGGRIVVQAGTSFSSVGTISTNNRLSISANNDIIIDSVTSNDSLSLVSEEGSVNTGDINLTLESIVNDGILIDAREGITTRNLRVSGINSEIYGDINLLSGGEIRSSDSIETSGRVRVSAASNVVVEGQVVGIRGIEVESHLGNVFAEGIDTSAGQSAGDISVVAATDIVAQYLRAESLNNGQGGDISLEAGGFIRITDTFTDRNGTLSSISSQGAIGGGDIQLRHGGNGVTDFVVGDATLNGSAGAIRRSNTPAGQITSGNFPYDYFQDQDRIAILSIPDPIPGVDTEPELGDETDSIVPSPPPPLPLSEDTSEAPGASPPLETPEISGPEEMAIASLTDSPSDTDTPPTTVTTPLIPPPATDSPMPPIVTMVDPEPPTLISTMSAPSVEMETTPVEPQTPIDTNRPEPTGDPIIDLANLFGNLIGFETSVQEQDNQLGIIWTGEDGITITQGVPITPSAPTPVEVSTEPVLLFPPPPVPITSISASAPPLLNTIFPIIHTLEDSVQTEGLAIALPPREIIITEQIPPTSQNTINTSNSVSISENLPNIPQSLGTFTLPTTAGILADLVATGSTEEAVTLADSILENQYETFFGEDLTQETVTVANIQTLLTKIEDRTGDRGSIIYALPWEDQLSIVVVSGRQPPTALNININRTDLINEVKQFIANIGDYKSDAYLKQAQSLYQNIVKPIEEHLKNNRTDTAIFALHGDIQGIPLAALHDGEKFLIEKLNVALIPSVSLTDKQYVDIQEARLLAMGTGDFHEALQQRELPGVPIELEAITNIWENSQKVSGEDFTLEELMTQREQESYGILHLATHAEFVSTPFGSQQSNLPKIYFWSQGIGLGSLRKEQWITPKNPLQLLVLSACDTLLGDYLWGEFGFAGLAINSGATSVLGSRWKVEDLATVALMGEFYNNLRSVSIKVHALRKAQLSLLRRTVLIENQKLVGVPEGVTKAESSADTPLVEANKIYFSHPYYWAAFDIVGSPW